MEMARNPSSDGIVPVSGLYRVLKHQPWIVTRRHTPRLRSASDGTLSYTSIGDNDWGGSDGMPIEILNDRVILYDRIKTVSRRDPAPTSDHRPAVRCRETAKSLSCRSRAIARADTPAAATRSTTIRAQGAAAFHASTSCREMKRMIPKPTVRPAKAMARR